MKKSLSGRRINTFKFYGVDTSKFVGINALVDSGGYVKREYTEDEFEIVGGKTIQEAGLYRRWVMAQTFHILNSNQSVYEYIMKRGSKYILKMLCHELEVQQKLKRNNDENYKVRNLYFNAELCADLFNIEYNANYNSVQDVLAKMRRLSSKRRIRIDDYKLHQFARAYSEIGAYYTLQNMLLFHDYKVELVDNNGRDAVKINDTVFDYDDRKRINLLDNMLYCGKYSNIPYLSDFLNKTIEFNNINISEKINSWRR